jgi:hypothetical protein
MRIEADKEDNVYKAIKKAKQVLIDSNQIEWEKSEGSKYTRFKEKITLVINEIELDISTESYVDDIAIIYNLKSDILSSSRFQSLK